MTIPERIAALRHQMSQHRLDAYIIPSSDPHQSEYVAAHWKGREWMSGFSGSAGTLIVTKDHAGVWTDSRYFLQGEEQLRGSGIELMKQTIPHAPEHIGWLADHLAEGARCGIDGRLFSVGQVRQLEAAFAPKKIDLQTDVDLLSSTWTGRPSLPETPIFEHDVRYTGESRPEKIERVRKYMNEHQLTGCLVSTLDDIAWLFNLRGKDVECNPVFYSFAYLTPKQTYLFIAPGKTPPALKEKLESEGIQIHPYPNILDHLKSTPADGRVLIDPSGTNHQLAQALTHTNTQNGPNILRNWKAIKNDTEVRHIREVMVKDGIALVHLFRWIEKTVKERSIPEAEVADRLIGFRRAQGDYHDESFAAIVGYKGNGAIVHYRPIHGSCADIGPEGILLIDSGGQYTNGTTDITRTVALSKPTAEQRKDYTLILKGHIELDRAVFPEGTTGAQLDTLARMHLWQHQLNFGHGTGHGVGFFLNVHEPPQGFSPNIHNARGATAFQAGMFTSNEPGLYKTDKYGMRIENLILCVPAGETEFGRFLKFETLTLFPMDHSLIDTSLLSKEERDWLNAYHQKVYDQLAPQLSGEEQAWLKEKCRAL
jgi:Xaa-Pro aminopeptidase